MGVIPLLSITVLIDSYVIRLADDFFNAKRSIVFVLSFAAGNPAMASELRVVDLITIC